MEFFFKVLQKIGNLDKMLKNLGNDDEDFVSKANVSPLKKSSFSNKQIDKEKEQYQDNADEILTRFYEKKNRIVFIELHFTLQNRQTFLISVACSW